MTQILNYFGVGGLAFVFLTVFVEITPIKLNPLGWIGKKLNSATLKEISKIDAKLDDHIVKSYRNDILNFQEELLFNPSKQFTRERWNNVIECCKKYENYIKENDLSNGQVEEATEYIRCSYKQALKARTFKDVPQIAEGGHNE